MSTEIANPPKELSAHNENNPSPADLHGAKRSRRSSRSKSPRREHKSPSRKRRSPKRDGTSSSRNHRSPTRRNDKSRSKSPKRDAKSPTRNHQSSSRRQDKPPSRNRSRSPRRDEKSPTRNHKSPTRRRNKSPSNNRSKSPRRDDNKSPSRERGRASDGPKQRDRSPKLSEGISIVTPPEVPYTQPSRGSVVLKQEKRMDSATADGADVAVSELPQIQPSTIRGSEIIFKHEQRIESATTVGAVAVSGENLRTVQTSIGYIKSTEKEQCLHPATVAGAMAVSELPQTQPSRGSEGIEKEKRIDSASTAGAVAISGENSTTVQPSRGHIKSTEKDRRPSPATVAGAVAVSGEDLRGARNDMGKRDQSNTRGAGTPMSLEERRATREREKAKAASGGLLRQAFTIPAGAARSSLDDETPSATAIDANLVEESHDGNLMQDRTKRMAVAAKPDEDSDKEEVAEELNAELERRKKKALIVKVCIGLAAITAIVVAVVVSLSNKGDEAAVNANPTGAPSNRNGSVDSTISSSPSTSPSLPPVQEKQYDPPGDLVCEAIARGKTVTGQEDMFSKNFTVPLKAEMTLVSNPFDISSLLGGLIQSILGPLLADCPNAETPYEEIASLPKYIFGNAAIDVDCVNANDCDVEESLCYSCQMSVELFLWDDAANYLLQVKISELLEEDDLVTFFMLDGLARNLEVGDPIAETEAPSDAPTITASRLPSVYPSSQPSSMTSSVPTIDRSNNPTFRITPGPTPPPTPFPTRRPTPPPKTPNPTRTPTPPPTPFPTRRPTPAPTPRPTPAPTRRTPPPTPNPTQAPTRGDRPTFPPGGTPSSGSGSPGFIPPPP